MIENSVQNLKDELDRTLNDRKAATVKTLDYTVKQELKKVLDSFGFDAGGYKVTLELWGDQRFDCGLDQCPDPSTGHKHARKIEFSRLSKDFAGDVK